MKFSGFNTTEKVGIGVGTSVPEKDLTVQSATSPAIGLYSTYADTNSRNWAINTNNSAYGDFTISTSAARLGNPTTIKMSILKDGKVGIGTTTQSHHLQMDVASGNVNFFAIRQADYILWSMGLKASDTKLYFRSGNPGAETDHVTFQIDGKVGIGTTSPAYNLHIKPASGNARLKLESDSNTADVEMMLDSASSTRNAHITFYNAGTQKGGVGYASSDTIMKMWGGNNPADDHLCINSSGSVGIGTPSPSVGLEVAKTSADASFKVNRTDQTNIQLIAAGSSYVRASAALILQSNGANNRLTLAADGSSTFSGSLKATTILDSSNSAGTNGQVLTSTGSALDWKTLSEISGVDGSGTANYIPKWTDSDTIGNSIVYNASYGVVINSTSLGSYATNRLVFEVKGTGGTGDFDGGITNLSASSNTNAHRVGQLAFINTANANHVNPNSTIGSRIAQIISTVVTSDSNAGDDSGGDLQFWTKPEAGVPAERMRIISGGAVGIGTNAPDSLLMVYKSGADSIIHVRGASNGGDARVRINGYNSSELYLDRNGVGRFAFRRTTGTDDLSLLKLNDNYTDNSTIMFWDYSSGKVGIGCVNPQNTFTVQVGTDHRIGFWGASTYSAIHSTNDANTAQKALRFDASKYYFMSGNVGIGTTSPSRILTINDATLPCVQLCNGQTGTAAGDGYQMQLSGVTGYLFNYDGQIIFGTSATVALTLDTSQNANFNGSIIFQSNGKVVEVADAPIQWYSYTDSAYKQANFRATDYVFKNGGNTAVATISSGGAATFSGNLTVQGDTYIYNNKALNILDSGGQRSLMITNYSSGSNSPYFSADPDNQAADTKMYWYIDGAEKMSLDSGGAATFTGAVTANAGLNIDNINIDGTTIALSSADLTLDVAGDIILDADGGDLIFMDGTSDRGRLIFNAASPELILKSQIPDADIKFEGNHGGVGHVTALTLDMSDAGTAIFNHDIKLADNSKAFFGNSNDLQLYHDGTHSYIDGTATGDLYVRSLNDDVVIQAADDVFIYTQAGENAIIARGNGKVELFYDGSSKLETTSGGISVTGTGTFSSGLYANGRLYLPNGSVSAPSLAFANDDDTGMYMGASVSLRFAQGGVDRLIIANGGAAEFTGALTVSGTTNLGGTWTNFGGGYGATGVSISNTGNIQANGTLTVDGALTVGSTTFTNSTRTLKWPNTSGQAASRSWGWVAEQGAYGYYQLYRSDASDGTLDTEVMRFRNTGNAEFRNDLLVDGNVVSGSLTITSGSSDTIYANRSVFGLRGNTSVNLMPAGTTQLTCATATTTIHNALTVNGSVGIVSGSGSGTLTGRLHIGSTTSTDNNSLVFWRGAKPTLAANQGAILYENGGMSDGEGMTFMSDKGYKFLDDAGTTEWARITSSGNVGIGTAGPSYRLSVFNTTASDNKTIAHFEGQGIGGSTDAGGQYISVNRTGPISQANGVMGGIIFGRSVPTGSCCTIRSNYKYTAGRDLEFLTSADNSADPVIRMTIKGSGKVGIGNTDPAAPLTVTADSGANAFALRARPNDDYSFIQFYNNAGSALRGQIYSKSTGDIGFTTGTDSSAGNDLYIKNGTGVGIGTASPSHKLDVVSAVDSDWLSRLHNTSTTTPSGLLIQTDTAASGYLLGCVSAGAYKFVVQSDGKVGIGTVGPTHYKLDVRATGVSTANFDIQEAATAITSGYKALSLSNSNATAGNHIAINFADTVGGSSTAIISAKCNDHTNNYGDLQFWTRGATGYGTRLHIDQEGHIGIGTTNPGTDLEVYKSSGLTQLYVNSGSIIARLAVLASNQVVVGSNSNADFWIQRNGVTKITVASSAITLADDTTVNGDVIINSGSSGATASLKFSNDNERARITSNYDSGGGGRLGFWTDSTGGTLVHRMSIDNNGNVGIGTTNPPELLSVKPSTGDAALAIYQDGTNANNFDCRLKFMKSDGWQIESPKFSENSNSKYDFGVNFNRDQYSGDFYIANNGTKRIKVDSSGHLLPGANGTYNLGSSGAYWKNAYLEDTSINGTLYVGGALTTNNSIIIPNASYYFGAKNTSGTGIPLMVLNGSNAMVLGGTSMATNAYPIRNIAKYITFEPAGGLGTGIETMRITNSSFAGVGSVGIGTTAPEAALHVVGGIHLNNASAISWDQAGGTLRNAIRVDGGDDLNIGDTNFDDIYFSTGQKTNCVSIKQTTGNFGIGTTAPTSKLHVTGDTGNSAFLTYIFNSGTQSEDNGLNVQIASSGTSAMALRVNTGGNSNALIVTGSGNVGLGYTAGNITEKFCVNGKTRLQSSGDGNNVLECIDSAGDVMFNIRQSSNDCLVRGYKDGGSQKWQIHSDGVSYFNGGKVGIGTTNPTNNLVVYATGHQVNFVTETDDHSGMRVKGADAKDKYILFNDQCKLGYQHSTATLHLCRSGAFGDNHLVINSNGNVGIGTATPGKALEVIAAANYDGIEIGSSSGHVRVIDFTRTPNSANPTARIQVMEPGATHTSDMRFYTSDAVGGPNLQERMIIDSDGSVGIGTNNPGALLHVYGAARVNTFTVTGTAEDLPLGVMTTNGSNMGQFTSNLTTYARLRIDCSNPGDAQIAFMSAQSSKWSIGNDAGDSHKFKIKTGFGAFSGAERFMIQADGNVGIGTNAAGYKFHVYGDILASGSIMGNSKSFVIDHPTKPNHKLQYGALEGPEFGVYHRGRAQSDTITLPDYWTALVREETITVQLTPKGSFQHLYVVSQSLTEIVIGAADGETIDCFYTIYAERADIDSLVVEKEV